MTVRIYASDGAEGGPGTLLGTTTISKATFDLPTPEGYLYGAFSSTISHSPDTLYWLNLHATAPAYGPRYVLMGYGGFGKYVENQFGDADEKMWGYGNPISDINFRICIQGDMLNRYVYTTISAQDISLKTYLKNWFKSTRTGSFLSHAFGESAINEQVLPLTLNEANAWEWKDSYIGAISAGSRDAVTKIGFKVTDNSQDFILKIDSYVANIGEPRPAIRRGSLLTYNALDTDLTKKNLLINGDFQVWQNGISFSSPPSGAYTADQWAVEYNSNPTFVVSRQSHTIGQTDVPDEPEYFIRFQATAPGSAATFRYLIQPIEDVRMGAGQDVTLTFYMKGTFTYPPTVKLRQDFGSGGSPSADVEIPVGDIALTGSWQKFTFSVKLPSISGKTIGTTPNTSYLGLIFSFDPNNNFAIDISHVDLKILNMWTPFDKRTYEEELWRCQRYLEIQGGQNSGIPRLDVGWSTEGALLSVPAFFKVEKRAAPTMSVNGTWVLSNATTAGAGFSDVRGYLFWTVAVGTGQVTVYPDTSDDTIVANAGIPL
jgi:hypothetical protein